MKVISSNTSFLDWQGTLLAIGFFEDQLELNGELATLESRVGNGIAELIAEADFKGKVDSIATTRLGKDSPIRKLAIVGLGKADEFNLDRLRRAGAAIAKLAKKERCQTVAISLPTKEETPEKVASALTEGLILGLHQDNRFKSKPDETGDYPQAIELLGLGNQETAIWQAEAICSGVILARELVAAPPNECTPETMAETARVLASQYQLELEILEQAECEALGMGAFLGVARASDLPPKFIHLTYKPQGTPRKKLGIIGKGLTFDSGGLNIKVTGSGIEMMKTDMGGAGATLGAAKAIAQLKPDVEVHFISAVTENMISGRALHPGDILKASNGKTIEVNNTDAEGRLTLADALVFTDKLELDAMVDLATLTGACVIALGDDVAGLWSPDDKLASELLQASEQSGEKIWRMPLIDKYFEGLKSHLADMKNTGPRPGGSITAALFLKEYVEKTPWAHLDVAGPVWADKDNGYNSTGATGYPVRTLVNWVLS
jgi:leucyl aminopeptidase